MNQLSKIHPARQRSDDADALAVADTAVRGLIGDLSAWLPKRGPEWSEDELEEMRAYELRTGREWGL